MIRKLAASFAFSNGKPGRIEEFSQPSSFLAIRQLQLLLVLVRIAITLICPDDDCKEEVYELNKGEIWREAQ
jgi:hypothetical protein